MRCCGFGIQAIAQKFEEIDSIAPFVIAVIVVMVVSTVLNDVNEWWGKQTPTTQNPTTVRGERLSNPVGKTYPTEYEQ